jgi:hypothetical protein
LSKSRSTIPSNGRSGYSENKGRRAPQPKGEGTIREVVISRDDAVFWLDSRGYWRNSGGRFRKKKIIDLFHASIARDADGYFLLRQKEEGGEQVVEKVYFPCEDTALFVFATSCDDDDGITCTLNTGRSLPLRPQNLYTRDDALYLREEGETIKFSERALLQIADRLTETRGILYIRVNGRDHPLPEAA